MGMTGRERFLTAIANKKPDRLPVQVHSWMQYYLNRYLGGMDQYQAYDAVGMSPVIYTGPNYIFDEKDLANWEVKYDTWEEKGEKKYLRRIITPDGELVERGGINEFTSWITEYPIKGEKDFEIWSRYVPLPKLDWTPVIEARKRIGDRGIVRGAGFSFGQGSPWQDLSTIMMGTEESIFAAFDEPEWVHHMLSTLLEKKLSVLERGGPVELDLVETGGGGGSSTVISPDMHREFCLPYDQKQHKLLHELGTKTVYHLCGGLMPLLETVVENGTDGLETMTPPDMGGDCDLAEAARRVGDKLFFIGGFDQNKGFERGTPENVREQVHRLFEAKPAGGYICSPSDHFFFGDPELLRVFVETARECVYS